MAGEIEMLSDVDVESVHDVCAVMVDSSVKLLCCASYVLLFAFGAGDEIDDVGRLGGV